MDQPLSKIISIVLVLFSVHASGQWDGVWPTQRDVFEVQQKHHNSPDLTFHSGIIPLYLPSDSLTGLSPEDGVKFSWNRQVKKVEYQWLPLITAMGGVEVNTSSQAIYQCGVGLSFTARNRGKWALYLSAYGEGLSAPQYVDRYIETNAMVPGMGRAYDGIFQTNFSRFEGFFRVHPAQVLFFEVGRGKQFIGEGHRSLLWSDFSSPANYFKLNLNVWHLNFSANYWAMNDLSSLDDMHWTKARKFSAQHYLSWNISPRVQIGLFETVIWQATDSGVYRGFDFNYFNPIAFYRPVEYAIGSADNALLGLNLKVNIGKRWTAYSQFLLDEFLWSEIRSQSGWWGNKFAFQLGVKRISERYVIRFEFNTTRPFTYTHGSVKQNYAHNHEPLAHPLGANFYEGLAQFNFKAGKRGYVENLALFYLKGEDPTGKNVGGDIFKPYTNPDRVYGNFIGQGNERRVYFFRSTYNFTLVSASNLNCFAGFQLRHESYLTNNDLSAMFFVGLSTQIWNRYSDF